MISVVLLPFFHSTLLKLCASSAIGRSAGAETPLPFCAHLLSSYALTPIGLGLGSDVPGPT
jgi:hypothetical protein